MTISTLRVHEIVKDKVLVSRESARLLEQPLRAMMANSKTVGAASNTAPTRIDFEGAEGVAPSFLDELLLIFESLVGAGTTGAARSLIVVHPPARLSLKFEATARGHGMSVRALPDGSWLLTDATP